jgi:hypothetical protein
MLSLLSSRRLAVSLLDTVGKIRDLGGSIAAIHEGLQWVRSETFEGILRRRWGREAVAPRPLPIFYRHKFPPQ